MLLELFVELEFGSLTRIQMLCVMERLSKEIKFEMGCSVHFLTPFLTAIGWSWSGIIGCMCMWVLVSGSMLGPTEGVNA